MLAFRTRLIKLIKLTVGLLVMITITGLWFGTFFSILGNIIPTDELIFFRGVGQPPTRYYHI
jgi:hypothetical protein